MEERFLKRDMKGERNKTITVLIVETKRLMLGKSLHKRVAFASDTLVVNLFNKNMRNNRREDLIRRKTAKIYHRVV